jgi:hypothetical protein
VVVLFLDLLLDSWCSFSPKGSRGFASSSPPALAVGKATNFSVREFISARIGSGQGHELFAALAAKVRGLVELK